MPVTRSDIQKINNPGTELLAGDAVDFLRQLGGPAWLTIPGRDCSRRRVIVTLLHGNEPSGLHAVQQIIRERGQPAVDLGILVAAVDAALAEPVLSHRYLPGERDLNRCFSKGTPGAQGLLAANIIDLITAFEPEAVVDTHNTSAHSKPFCVAVHDNPATLSLAGAFTDTLVLIDQPMGTLLNHLPERIPAATVEFGSLSDAGANELALHSLRRFVTDGESHSGVQPRVLRQPLRLETGHRLNVVYSSGLVEQADLTIINSVDQLNFRDVEAGTLLGWFSPHEHSNLVARRADGSDVFASYFSQDEGLLRTRVPITIFMATTDPNVANNDCLLYFVGR